MSRKKIILVVLLLIPLTVLSGIIYYYRDYFNPKKDDTKMVMNQLSKIVDVSGMGEASIATVTDKEKLNDQPFFANAQNGDKLVTFVSAKKIILFRPSTGKIVNFGALSLNENTTVSESTLSSPAPNSGK